jgi:GNAT superfamily N-acetyltransferase
MRSINCPTPLQFHDLASHFLALNAGDRFLRFGYAMSDVDIVAYVERLMRSIGDVFVVAEPAPDISGVVHVEMTKGGAELGLSVSAWGRGKGIGTLLLEKAALLASSRGVSTLFVRNLNFNSALRRLAHRVGLPVACAASTCLIGSELSAPEPWAGLHAGPPEIVTLADHSLRSLWEPAAWADCRAEPDQNARAARELADVQA